MNIEVYADGSATIAEKPGGYGWVMVIDGKKHSEGSGYMEKASNNDSELEAAIQGLQAVREYLQRWLLAPKSVTLVSDSQIVLGWTNGSYRFKQENKIQKFKELQMLVNLMGVQTRWVEGHTGDEHNERCDKLANAARLEKSIEDVIVKEPLRRIWVHSRYIPKSGDRQDACIKGYKDDEHIEFVEVRKRK